MEMEDSGKMENTYRLTDRDTRLMIQLRATNEAIFTGRRNSAMRGWKAIRREMGLHGVMSARQLKKKWDNLKEKYRALKNPPEGMETQTQPNSWRWFQLMDEAMTGRLAGTANIVQPSVLDEEDDNAPATPPLILPNMATPFSALSGAEMAPLEDDVTLEDAMELRDIEDCRKVELENKAELLPQIVSVEQGDGSQVRIPVCKPQTQTAVNSSQTAVFYATLLPEFTVENGKTPSSSKYMVRETVEVDRKLAELQKERQALEREQAEFDRELIALEKDRELLRRDAATLERDRTSLDRERAALERDRAAMERDRAAVERDRVFLDRDRAFVDRDRAFVERDRVLVERAQEDLERERAVWRREREGEAENGHPAEMASEKEVVLQTRFYQRLTAADLDPEQLETRQRLVSLFQRLVEKL
ncbi:uncharacterized protein LOC132973004 isoform X1 [Labrus mixtus]|uniref:uncharacterized protein LOC132973004 isoform X1 n=3 Tax=Labrus mixtus TaxID=508554 RepID=UPI0029C0065C|nr:uncharacterized protein LOC132973004 isoform X1 [Labrus mixtus]